MKSSLMITACLSLLFLSAAAAAPPKPPPVIAAPAPAPAPEYVNLTDLLSVAGPFSTFLKYLESTKVIDTFQNQANNSVDGITIFVPKDQAFSSLKSPSLSNLTSDQLKSLVLFHALPKYYPLSDFTNLSRQNPVSTLAGSGSYALNFTDNSGTVNINSGWTSTKVSSAVRAANPVAVYQVDKVLLPVAIFGTDIPPTPAPVPAPAAADTDPADQRARGGGRSSAGNDNTNGSPNGSPSPSSSPALASGISNLGMLVVCAIVLVLNTSIGRLV